MFSVVSHDIDVGNLIRLKETLKVVALQFFEPQEYIFLHSLSFVF